MILSAWFWDPRENTFDQIPVAETATANQVAEALPEGVYTTIRTYPGNRVLRWEQHIQRLRQSTELVSGHSLWMDSNELRNKMRIAISETKESDNYKIRIHIALNKSKPIIYVIIEDLVVPSNIERLSGAVVVTRRMHRDNPRAKGTDFIRSAERIRSEIPEGVNEVLMVGEQGQILEGLSSNFFAVQRNTIWTADEGVLNGITRGLILEAISDLGLRIIFKAFLYEDMDKLSEAFITSTSRGVLAIRRIDKIDLPFPVPGELTERIVSVYQDRIIRELEPL